jgi:hypothetical protein
MNRFIAATILLASTFPIMHAQSDYSDVPKIRTKQIIDYSGKTTSQITYRYDYLGRCIELTEAIGDAYTNTYEYPDANTVVIKTAYERDPETTYEGKFILNYKGLAIRFESTDTTARYFYNSYGFNVTSYVSDPENTRDDDPELDNYLTVKDGNMVWDNEEDYYYYFEDRKNTLGNENTGVSFFGKDNANLIKAEEISDDLLDVINYDYTYDFDSKGRATMQKWESDFGDDSQTIYITYTD